MKKSMIFIVIAMVAMTTQAKNRFEVFPLLQVSQLSQSSVNGLTIYLSGHEILTSISKEAGIHDIEDQLLSIRVSKIDFDAQADTYRMTYELLNNNGAIVSVSTRKLEEGSDGWLYLVGGK